jgi:hypothetical protein
MAVVGEAFTQKDAENLERVKDAMAELAVGKAGVLGSGPDAAAAAAFAQLLDAETRREELALRNTAKASEISAPDLPGPKLVEETPWTHKVLGEDSKPIVAAALAS